MSWFSRKPKTIKSKTVSPARKLGPIAKEQWEDMKSINSKKMKKKPIENSS